MRYNVISDAHRNIDVMLEAQTLLSLQHNISNIYSEGMRPAKLLKQCSTIIYQSYENSKRFKMSTIVDNLVHLLQTAENIGRIENAPNVDVYHATGQGTHNGRYFSSVLHLDWDFTFRTWTTWHRCVGTDYGRLCV